MIHCNNQYTWCLFTIQMLVKFFFDEILGIEAHLVRLPSFLLYFVYVNLLLCQVQELLSKIHWKVMLEIDFF
jgi:hypothetical protein